MKANIVVGISPPIPYLAKFWFLIYGPLTTNLQKGMAMKLIFCLQINTKVFYKLIVSSWMCIAMHIQSTQNKFTISFQ